jgi:hypothetical protein
MRSRQLTYRAVLATAALAFVACSGGSKTTHILPGAGNNEPSVTAPAPTGSSSTAVPSTSVGAPTTGAKPTLTPATTHTTPQPTNPPVTGAPLAPTTRPAPVTTAQPAPTTRPAPPPTTQCTIPQNGGGDGDSDNFGGPSDGDGCDV